MNWKLISLGSIGIFALIVNMISEAADRQLSVDAGEKAVKLHSAETEQQITEANDKIALVDALNKREQKEIRDETNSWMKLNNYESRKREVHRACENEMVEFRESVNYYNRKQSILDEADDKLTAVKESMDYDYEIKKHEGTIDDAKSLYKKKCKLYDIAGNDDAVSEDAAAMKAKAKAAMDETVKEAKDSIKELKSKLDVEANKINREKQAELRDLEYELQSEKTRLAKVENEQLDAIEKELSIAKDDIRAKVIAKRTDEEVAALSDYEQCKDKLSDQKIADADKAMDIYNSTPSYERMGAYLRKIKCPKWFAGLVAVLPLIPAGYLGFVYGNFVVKTLKAM